MSQPHRATGPALPELTGAAVEGQVPDARFLAVGVRSLWPRVATAVAAAIGMVPFLPYAWIAVWLALALAMPVISLRMIAAAGENGPRRADLAGNLQISALVSGVIFAGAASVMWFTHDGVAAMFALAICWIALVYVLMQYYAHPRAFALAASPYLLAMSVMGIDGGLRAAQAHRPGHLVTIAAVATIIAIFVVMARRQLAASRFQLRAARAIAREREQAATQANKAKSLFLATMSHEIRTPLNGVLGMAQALASEDLSGAQRDQLAVIRKSGEALMAILNDVLDISKIEAGKMELEAIEFDLGEVVRGAHDAFTALAKTKGLRLSLTVAAAAEGLYLGDPTRVRQILYNFISNAVKFTQRGGVDIEVDRDGDAVRVAIRDTGPGIAPDRLSGLFGNFVQADASMTRRFGGTGLGLAISRELAELMSGKIEVESHVGRGSCFTLALPLPRIGAAPAAADPAPPARSAALAGRAVRVLAAEDNPVNQIVLKTLLAQIGIEPALVGDGIEALEAWAGAHWDAILMDVQMPRMDGLAAVREIRAREAASGRPRTPVFALTADAMAHQVAEYAAAGMDGHVVKPVDARRLFEALETALRRPEDTQASLAAARSA